MLVVIFLARATWTLTYTDILFVNPQQPKIGTVISIKFDRFQNVNSSRYYILRAQDCNKIWTMWVWGLEVRRLIPAGALNFL